uniref:Transcription initiation protein SPT3 homolog n=1 Tax=Clastoptera arizonana TaxID=38151 RepID=A0A1B6CVS2_9HEMI
MQATSTSKVGPIPKEPVTFVKEIQLMMFGLGDSPTPLLSTALVVESIVFEQIKTFVEILEESANRRESDIITQNDVLFLLRKDKHKLHRLLNYISIKESRHSLKSAMSGSATHTNKEDPTVIPGIIEKKGKLQCIDFLKSIGVTLELCDAENINKERDLRLFNHVTNMSNESYSTHYSEARRASFATTGLSNTQFLEWLKSRSIDFPINKIKSLAADMLIYLAKETVAQLVDLAFLVRQDTNMVPGEPFSHAQQAGCLPYDSFGPAQRQIDGAPPLHPNEIREVLRRYWSTQSHPWGSFSVDITCRAYQRLL